MTVELDVEAVREQFPGLANDFVLLDNAGGSQILARVVDRLRDYLLHTNVQLGASYDTSERAGARYREGRESLARLINAERPEEVVLGASSTVLAKLLSQAMAGQLKPGDEVVVTNCDHETNIGPWVALREQGVDVKVWRVDADQELRLEDLERLLTDRTRLLCFTHVSNILGTVNPVAEITRFAHERGVKVCVDGVAYAPHRRVDVRALGVDFYFLSIYKTYGPHYALLYGRYDELLALKGRNHFFVGEDEVPYKLEPGNANYELAYASGGVTEYLEELGRRHGGGDAGTREDPIDAAFEAIERHETRLATELLDYLGQRSDVRVMGRAEPGSARVPTISFVVDGHRSEAIVRAVDELRIGIRYGHFYARRLIEDLGLDPDDGVVRVSMVHYNTVSEVRRLIDGLDRILGQAD